MGIFSKLLSARQSQPANPSAPDLYFVNPPTAGVYVDEHVALTYSAVWACVRAIAETFAYMSWHVYEYDDDVRKVSRDHPADYLLHRQPNPEMSAFTFKETISSHVSTWGNGYAEIERSRLGDPVALWLLTPDRVTPKRDPRGRLYYEFQNDDGSTRQLRPENVYHLKGLGFNGLTGYSPVELAKESISAGLAARKFAGSLFGNGAIPSGIIEIPQGVKVTEETIENLLKTFNKRNQGAAKANKTEVLDRGMTYKQISIPPEQAQFLESRKFEVSEICRWFRVPPHKVADLDRATFSNIEQQDIQFVVDSIVPLVTKAEQEADIKLLSNDRVSIYVSKMNVKSLMRGDSKARGEFYKTMFNIGVYSINEIRKFEDENPIGPDGDVRLVPMNMVTLENAGKNPTQPSSAAIRSAHISVFNDAAQRIANKEFLAVSKMAKKPDFDALVCEFYDKNRAQFVEGFKPAVTALTEVVCITRGFTPSTSLIDATVAHIGELVSNYLDKSKILLTETVKNAELSVNFELNYKTSRPNELAKEIAERVVLFVMSQGGE